MGERGRRFVLEHRAYKVSPTNWKRSYRHGRGLMLKICIVNPFEARRGAEYQIGVLIDALIASNRYEVHYLTHLSIRATERSGYTVSRVGDGGPVPRLGYLMEGISLVPAAA